MKNLLKDYVTITTGSKKAIFVGEGKALQQIPFNADLNAESLSFRRFQNGQVVIMPDKNQKFPGVITVIKTLSDTSITNGIIYCLAADKAKVKVLGVGQVAVGKKFATEAVVAILGTDNVPLKIVNCDGTSQWRVYSDKGEITRIPTKLGNMGIALLKKQGITMPEGKTTNLAWLLPKSKKEKKDVNS